MSSVAKGLVSTTGDVTNGALFLSDFLATQTGRRTGGGGRTETTTEKQGRTSQDIAKELKSVEE